MVTEVLQENIENFMLIDLRMKMIAKDGKLDSIELIKTLDKFSTTPDYAKRVIVIIKKIRKYEEKI